MLIRKCVCGANIPINRSICGDCSKQYGSNSKLWPDWLKFLSQDNQKEVDRERRHDELELFENKQYQPISNIARYNLNRAREFPEMEIEDFNWFIQ